MNFSFLLGLFISFFSQFYFCYCRRIQYASFFILIFRIYIHNFCPAFIIILPKLWLQCSCSYPFIRQYYPISASLSYMHSKNCLLFFLLPCQMLMKLSHCILLLIYYRVYAVVYYCHVYITQSCLLIFMFIIQYVHSYAVVLYTLYTL